MVTGKAIAKGALVVMTATLLSRLFGFLREVVIAGRFGLSTDMDAYLVAYSVPSGVAAAVSAALNAGFIPVLSDLLVRGERQYAVKIANTLINIVFVVLLVIVGISVLFAPSIAKAMAPGFDSQSVSLTSNLIKLMFPALIFASLVGITSGFLHSYQHFLFPALGPMAVSVVIISAALLSGRDMSVEILAISTTAGFFLQFLMQIPVMYKKGFRYRLNLALSDPGVLRVFKLMAPVLVASSVPPLMIIVERNLASNLAVGSISALNYAYRLMQLPLGLFLMAVSVPLFPALSSLASERDFEKLKDTIFKGINFLALIMIPVTAGLIALNTPIIRLLFERGAFGAEDTQLTAYALSFYALALFPASVRDIFRRSFYSLQDTMTPVLVTVIGLITNVVLDLVLINIMGMGGLALGAALTAVAETLILYFLLKGKIGSLPVQKFGLLMAKLTAAAFLMGVLVWIFSFWLGTLFNMSAGTGKILQVGLCVFTGAGIYLLAIVLLKVREAAQAFNMLKGILKRF